MSTQRGFSLIEIAVVMVIIGLIIVGSLTAVSGLQENQQAKNNTLALNTAIDALLGYASSRPGGVEFLPCPDNNGDGLEEARIVNVCPFQEGWLPFVTLGLNTADAWGNRIRYRVDANFSNGAGFDLADEGNLGVCTTPACVAANGEVLAQNLPAVLISHGKNARGARTSGTAPSGGFVLITQPAGVHELDNTNGRNAGDTADVFCPAANPPAVPSSAPSGLPASCHFISLDPRDSTGVGGEFDDTVVWLSAATLFNQMVKAGRLP